MDKASKVELIASSSGWVSALLNFFPGLGVGYIYQRRWKAYWITNLVSVIWLIYGFYSQLENDPSDPIQLNNDQQSFFGLFIIATVSSVEAWYASQKAKERRSSDKA